MPRTGSSPCHASGTWSSGSGVVGVWVGSSGVVVSAVLPPGSRFRDVHAAAMEVVAARLAEWGLLPGTVEESLDPEGQFHRRWMVHGTSHHLGMDVHDCAQARREMYLDAVLEPGMVFTIEPGLYFKSDDLAVPEEYRGIGVRIEDDVLITHSGCEVITKLPRSFEDCHIE